MSLEEINQKRVGAQVELISKSLELRHQTIVTILVSSIAVVSLANLVEAGIVRTVLITALFALSIALLWFDITSVRKALLSSQEIINEINGPEFAKVAEAINKSPKYLTYFTEISGTIFSIIVLVFILLLFLSPASESEIKSGHHQFYQDSGHSTRY